MALLGFVRGGTSTLYKSLPLQLSACKHTIAKSQAASQTVVQNRIKADPKQVKRYKNRKAKQIAKFQSHQEAVGRSRQSQRDKEASENVHFAKLVDMEVSKENRQGLEVEKANEEDGMQWKKAMDQLYQTGGAMEELRSMLPNPKAKNVAIRGIEFVKSSFTWEECPPGRNKAEIAVLGRSNVGKSSLVNLLAEMEVANISKNPGRTKSINHYLVNQNWYLVDLPGYGFAKASVQLRETWGKFTMDYLKNRQNLAHCLLLVDSNLPPQELDIKGVNFFVENDIPFTIVFTKSDKLQKSSAEKIRCIDAFKFACKQRWGVVPFNVVTSAVTFEGKRQLLFHMAQMRDLFMQERQIVEGFF